ncbi:BREX-2 system adenine-specific DNA-methyltransferase PglX [Microbacterium mitrae]|uniref:site-specific DNA-methyltransferase (adenine-specific) n=1 Tax=Microbacterium mitrae TaxID=664640 RepID=A0A5C8HND1_9MICO|nr:BREX-2 system adenine-specific DNA-methyltransferase PglX [Microbacterium mitrae]TXK03391.1 BREX-2 system adenine-specific DNA-methyltransferase PglX [Microbacterium mitrae]
MIDSKSLLSDLKRELSALEEDLTVLAENSGAPWGAELREEYDRAKDRDRTGLSWIDWRNGEVAQAAVAWIIATVFIRFCEDNRLLSGAKRDGRVLPQPWIAAPGDGLERAVENESAFYTATPTMTGRDWLQVAFDALAELPAGRTLVDPKHSPVWNAPISASAADRLLAFFRRVDAEGELIHDFSDADLGTRFLGDLYQDLSDYAKKTFALLQTPDFVEEFILDQTLTPAIQEFGLTGLKLIDPACGSGHFLLGAFDRLVDAWDAAAPGADRGERVQRALDSIHGVDLNPFAIAIARFRLTVAALRAARIGSLVNAPAFKFHLAIGDSLLGGSASSVHLDLGDGEYVPYNTEDLTEYSGILENGQYHVVVANPPYITVKDGKLSERYRAMYSTCHGKYALSVPFMELLFRLAKPARTGAGGGYVGQITANSFMKREFGKKLIHNFLSGTYTSVTPDYVDLTHIIDTSGAYIPGHGTPTVILVGRPQKPQLDTVRAVLGVRGEPGQPAVPADGKVWRDIVDHLDAPGYDGPYVSVIDATRDAYSTYPWSMSGGGASELKTRIEAAASTTLHSHLPMPIGFASFPGNDEPFFLDRAWFNRNTDSSLYGKPLVIGEYVRDWNVTGGVVALAPRNPDSTVAKLVADSAWARHLWRFRATLASTKGFGSETMADTNSAWWAWYRWVGERYATPLSITFAFVATHNHFVLDRGGKVFKQSAPVIKLPEGASEDDHYDLLGVLNSSTACFWLKQVSHNKGDSTDSRGARVTGDPAFDTYEFTSTKLKEFPLPARNSRELTRQIDDAARERQTVEPATLIEQQADASSLAEGRIRWEQLGGELVWLQEELDWHTYESYGLVDASLAPEATSRLAIEPAARPFEIALARDLSGGRVVTSWFDRHHRTPVTAVSSDWPSWYRDLVERRLTAISRSRDLRLLEQPDYKRRWAGLGWDELLAAAVRDAMLDNLESLELWTDSAERPLVRSVAQIADELRHDERLRELMTIHTGSRDYDLVVELGKLMQDEAVPAFAPLRYKPAGIEKFRAWEQTWELQRAQDRGEQVDVPVPPKYKPADFLKQSYWSARGKLDVPKERFIAFPGSTYAEDGTAVYGWAGWNHSERGQAIARFATQVAPSVSDADQDQLVPLLGALIELQPWLDQWHNDMDSRGIKPSTAIQQTTNTLLARLNTGRDEVLSWRPSAPKRGRNRA